LDCRIYLQNELKFAILTIGNLRNKTISEYTDISLFYEDKLFFPDIKEEFIRDSFSSFYEFSGKNCMAKIEQLCSCSHSYSHLTLVYKLIDGGLAPQIIQCPGTVPTHSIFYEIQAKSNGQSTF
jgi:hypothetical protein